MSDTDYSRSVKLFLLIRLGKHYFPDREYTSLLPISEGAPKFLLGPPSLCVAVVIYVPTIG